MFRVWICQTLLSVATHLSFRGLLEYTRKVKLDSCPGSNVVGRTKYPPCSSWHLWLTCM